MNDFTSPSRLRLGMAATTRPSLRIPVHIPAADGKGIGRFKMMETMAIHGLDLAVAALENLREKRRNGYYD